MTQNKKKSLLWCTQYKCRRHVLDMPLVRLWGFPWLPSGLKYWLCGLKAVERPAGSPRNPDVFICFFLSKKMPWSSFQGQNHRFFCVTLARRRWEANFLATGEQRGGALRGKMKRGTVFTCADSRSSKTSVSEGCIAQFKENDETDMWLGGYWLLLLFVVVVGGGDEAVNVCCVAQHWQQRAVSNIVCLDDEPTRRPEGLEGGLAYESRESTSCGGSTLISSVSSVSSLISSSASSSSSSSLAMSWRASLMFRPSL